MASIGGVSGNNMTSSLYNSANVISGLASGLDTESMIEGLVQSYQKKIQSLSNKATKLEWKQEAYRSIITKMNAFASKYTSYSSATNLMSASFFSSAVKIATMGANKDKVTASGRTDSDVKLNSVKQLASAARYTTSSNLLGINSGFAITGDGMKFDETLEMGALSGSLSLNYGGKTVSIVFDPNKDIIPDTKKDASGNEVSLTATERAAELEKVISKKLSEAKITLSSGETKSASELIDVKLSGGKITFADKSTGGNSVYLSGASGTVESVLGLDLENAEEDKPASIDVTKSGKFTLHPTVAETISKQPINISLDGKSKSLYLPKVSVSTVTNDDGTTTRKYSLAMPEKVTMNDGSTGIKFTERYKDLSEEECADKYAEMVNEIVKDEFAGKIKVTNEGEGGERKLKFQAPDDSSLIIDTDAGRALGLGGTSATNYLNTSKTLGELLPAGTFIKDYDGNEVKRSLTINGVEIGKYTSDTKLSDILSDINANTAAGVKVSYSQTSRQFTFTSKETGADTKINIDGGLAEEMFGSTELSDKSDYTFGEAYGVSWLDGDKVNFKFPEAGGYYSITVNKDDTIEDVAEKLNGSIFNHGYTASYNKYTGELEITDDKSGAKVDMDMWADHPDPDFGRYELEFNEKYAPEISYTPGQDAKFEVEVNGETLTMTRPSNSVNIDGMTLNFKETFEGGESVTFHRSTDSDKIVDAVKSMIADYNEMMSEIRSQYATLPYKSNGSFQSYEPLTDEDKATMSESAIQKYEEKAKQGLLFSDTNLSALYDRMLAVFSPGGEDGALLRQMGITMDFSSTDGSSSITLDESKLRSMLDSDPDAVADLFTRSSEAGGASNGIMQGMKTQLDRYAGITGATKGILVQQAGTPLSSLTLMNNNWQNQIDGIYTDIEKWQDKLSAQVDKYTSMFSKLETLIYQMNSQSSTLAGLMGG